MTTHVEYLAAPRRALLARLADDLVGTAARWYERRKAVAELNALPDHLLSDIGLDRAGIPAAVESMLKQR